MADIAQRRDKGLSQKALADMTGIERDHVVAALREIFEGEVTRPHIDRRRPDHRDRFYAVENFADVTVRVGVMVHYATTHFRRHCEERSDEAIQALLRRRIASLRSQ